VRNQCYAKVVKKFPGTEPIYKFYYAQAFIIELKNCRIWPKPVFFHGISTKRFRVTDAEKIFLSALTNRENSSVDAINMWQIGSTLNTADRDGDFSGHFFV